MQWLATPSGKRGRQQIFSDASIQFCLSLKCLFNLALRQTLGMVQSLLQLAGTRLASARLQHAQPSPKNAQGAAALPA
jgi:hypothetical protein